MSITVKLPTISMMKMEYKPSLQLNNPTEGFTLQRIKQEIFNKAWETMEPLSWKSIHGGPEDILLSDEYDVEITDDAILKDRIDNSVNFKVVFRGHQKDDKHFFPS